MRNTSIIFVLIIDEKFSQKIQKKNNNRQQKEEVNLFAMEG